MSLLQGMTESLFAETLKRIAEDVWGKKFKEAALNFKDKYSGGSSNTQLQQMFTDAFLECLKKDSELKQALQDALMQAAREYFQLKIK
jgi:hypothetical protein